MAYHPEIIFAEVPRLETSRLVLREIQAEDAEGLFSVYRDAAVGQYNRWKIMEDVEEAREKIALFRQHFEEGKRVRWGLVRKEDDVVIGDVAFVSFDARADLAEIGFNLARNHWRKGFMREAVEAVLQHGFTMYGLNRVQAQVVAANIGSTGLLKRMGFVKEGLLREGGNIRGEYVDLEIWGLLAKEFGR